MTWFLLIVLYIIGMIPTTMALNDNQDLTRTAFICTVLFWPVLLYVGVIYKAFATK